MPADKLRLRHHDAEELSHYSRGTADVEFPFPWGWDELEGIANRGDYDLSAHAAKSGETLDYFDQQTNERYTPYVIEPAAGATRTMMAFLLAAYGEDEVGGEAAHGACACTGGSPPTRWRCCRSRRRTRSSPWPGRSWPRCSRTSCVDYDVTQSIGRRYRRQDEIGTPWCVTVDFDSLEDDAVTVRDRDTTEQVRVPIADLVCRAAAAHRRGVISGRVQVGAPITSRSAPSVCAVGLRRRRQRSAPSAGASRSAP